MFTALSLVAALLPSALTATAPPAHDTTSTQTDRQVAVPGTALVGRVPLPVTSFGACVSDGWLYTLGGYHGRPHDYSREAQSGLLMRLSLDQGHDSEVLEHQLAGLQSVELVEYDGQILRVGGMRALNASDEPQSMVSLDEVARWNATEQCWQVIASLPSGRSSHAAAVVGDELFVVGGWNIDGDLGWLSTFHEQTWVLDLEGSAGWRSIETPFARRALDIAPLEGQLVAVGGMTEEDGVSARVDVLDIASGVWSRAPDLPKQGFGVAVCTAPVAGSERVFASCGSGMIWSWSPGQQSWAPHAQLLFPRIFHELVSDGSELIVVGGISGGERVRHIERIALDPPAESDVLLTSASHVRMPWPGQVRNRWAAHLRGDDLFLFGGNTGTDQHDFDRERFSNESWSIDLVSLEVARLADLPVERQSMRTARNSAGNILALGGFGWDDEMLRSHDQVFEYDLETNAWRELAPLPSALTQFGLLELPTGLTLFGGLDYADRSELEQDDFALSDRVLQLDFEQDSTATVEAGSPADAADAANMEPGAALPERMPKGRRAHGCAELDGRVYLVGGLGPEFSFIDDVDVLELESGTWSTVSAPVTARIAPRISAIDGRLYAVAGAADRGDGSQPDRVIESYDPETDSWSVLDYELPIDPRHVAVFEHRGRMLVVSTMTAGTVDLLWIDLP